MAKKVKAKKTVKKLAKKAAKKAVKKSTRSVKRKVAKKTKPVKKAVKKKITKAKKLVKKSVKKAAKKVVKKKLAKKAVKKVAKKTAKKTTKKVTKKAVKTVKKVAPKTIKKPFRKIKSKKVVSPASHATIPASIIQAAVGYISHAANHTPKIHTEPVKKTETVENPVTATKVENEKFVQHQTYLQEGDAAPYFEGVDQNGNTVKSTDFLGKTLILYFYPKDDTPGCTTESCNLRDEYQYLNNNNYAVVGVSADDVNSHKKFADKYSLPFPLIADTNKTIIEAYDVWGQKQLAGRIYDGIVRTTFVIDAEGNLKNIINKVDTSNHTKQILSL